MNPGWVTKRLGDVCEFAKAQGKHAGLPYVGLEDIESDTAQFIGTMEPQDVRSATFRFTREHLLYGRLRPYLNKVLAPDFDGHCSTEIFPLKPGSDVLREYLVYWFLASGTVVRVNGTCTGARMPRADMNAVMRFELHVPPLAEQRRVVEMLDRAFDAVATLKANYDRCAEATREAFAARLHATFSDPPRGWTTSKIGEHINFIDYRGRTPEKTDAGTPLITAKNVKMGFVQEEPREYVAPETYATWMTRGIPRRGDVLFTTEAPLGNVAQLDTDENVVFAQRIIIMQPDATYLDSTFLKFMLLSPVIQQRIREMGTGATATGIKASLLKLIPISFPSSVADQKAIADEFTELDAQLDALRVAYSRKAESVIEFKESLLHHALTGQV